MNDFYTVTEYSKITGKDPGNIRRLLIDGRLNGEKIGKQWIIPKGTAYPKDNRIISGEYQNWRKSTKFNSNNKKMKKAFSKMIPEYKKIYGKYLKKIVLYGSYAKGTQTDDSDIDIAIFLERGHTKKMHDNMIDFIINLELEYGSVFSVIDIDIDDYAKKKDILPFYKNIKKEGIILWKTA